MRGVIKQFTLPTVAVFIIAIEVAKVEVVKREFCMFLNHTKGFSQGNTRIDKGSKFWIQLNFRIIT